MSVKINGQWEDIPVGGSLFDLLNERGLNRKGVVILLNDKVIRENEWPKITINNKDTIDILSFVSGG